MLPNIVAFFRKWLGGLTQPKFGRFEDAAALPSPDRQSARCCRGVETAAKDKGIEG